MPNPTDSHNTMFDLKRIKRLVELMKEHELAELDIQQADMRIQLKRNTPAVSIPLAASVPVSAPAPQSAPPSATALVEAKNIHVIKSPMVGTFYSASNPDSPPFAKVGDTVNAETTVCLIEAMKVYNEIQAECAGTIVAVLVKNGETVEFGKPLFSVKTE